MVLSTVRHQPNGGKLPWTVFKLFSDTFSYRELKLYSKFRAKFEPLQITPEIIWKSTNMTYICQNTTLLSLFLAFRHVKCGKINLTSWKPGQIIITTTIIIIIIIPSIEIGYNNVFIKKRLSVVCGSWFGSCKQQQHLVCGFEVCS